MLQWTWQYRDISLTYWFQAFQLIPRNGFSGSYRNSTFSVLRDIHGVFLNGCIHLNDQKPYPSVLFSPPSCPDWYHFSQMAILKDVRWQFTVILIWASWWLGVLSIFHISVDCLHVIFFLAQCLLSGYFFIFSFNSYLAIVCIFGYKHPIYKWIASILS